MLQFPRNLIKFLEIICFLENGVIKLVESLDQNLIKMFERPGWYTIGCHGPAVGARAQGDCHKSMLSFDERSQLFPLK